VVLYKTFTGWQQNKTFGKSDNALNGALIGLFHLQLLLGLILYFQYSPMSQAFLQNPGYAMKVKELRFWGLEHALTMIIAVAVAQFGRIYSKKASTDLLKHKRAFIFLAIALVLILLRMPYTSQSLLRGL
jgi:hypothetical protein